MNCPESVIKIGDFVKIRGTPATLALDLAGQVGQIRTIANPRDSAIAPIGISSEGDAYEVYVEPLGTSFWIMAPLLLPLEAANGRATEDGQPTILARFRKLMARILR